MKRFKNILYVLHPLSSLENESTADKVALLAKTNKAKVTVLTIDENHIMEDLGSKIIGIYGEIQKAHSQQKREELHTFLEHDRWCGVETESHLTEGNDIISIVRKIIRDKHDLVIKDAPLDRGLDQLSMKFVRKCPCPVWIMKRDDLGFKRVLAAVDVSNDQPDTLALNRKIIELSYSLAAREKGEAYYLHSWCLDYEAMLRSPRFKVPPEEIYSMKREIYTKRHSRLLTLLKEGEIPYEKGQVLIQEGYTTEILHGLISKINIDTVVMGSIGRAGIPGLLIGNGAEKILSRINCTVLTVKPDNFMSPVSA